MSDETRVFARSSALTKRKQRAAKRAARVNWRARLRLKRMEKSGRIAAVERMLEEEAAQRAREHKRPDVKPTPLDILKGKLTEPEIKAADRIYGLWALGAITSRRVTANYGNSTGGHEELSEIAEAAWSHLCEVYRHMTVVEREAVAGLVCYDETREPTVVRQGLAAAARHFGYM